MPSIEIVCVGQTTPRQFGDMPFAIEASSEVRSHRMPSALWQAEFDEVQGCIYHLGNPNLRDPDFKGTFFASELLAKSKPDWFHVVQFTPEYEPALRKMLSYLLTESPEGRIFFTSDYQFGPDPKRYKRPISLSKFWQLHDAAKIQMNAFYELR